MSVSVDSPIRSVPLFLRTHPAATVGGDGRVYFYMEETIRKRSIFHHFHHFPIMRTVALLACSPEMKDFNGVCGMYASLKSFGVLDEDVVILFNGTDQRLESVRLPNIYVQQKELHTHDVCFAPPPWKLFRTVQTKHQFDAYASEFAKSAQNADSIVLVFSFHGVERHLLFENSILSMADATRPILTSTTCPTLVFLNKCWSGETASALVEEFGHSKRPLVVFTSSRSGPSLMLPGTYAVHDGLDADLKEETVTNDERVCSAFLRASFLSLCEVAFRPTVTIGQHLERVQDVIKRLRGDKTCEPPAVFPLDAYTLTLDTFLPIDFASMDPLFEYTELQALMKSVYIDPKVKLP